MDVMIDPVLLTSLRRAGMDDRTIAIHAAGVLRHDARSVRAMGVAGPGEATFEDDVVMAPVRLAHGIHWCGGMIRMTDAHRTLPAAVLEAAAGMPLSRIIDHPLIDGDVKITGHCEEEPGRFGVGGAWRTDAVPVTVILTDSQPTTLKLGRRSGFAAPFIRMWGDRAVVEEMSDRTKTVQHIAGYALLGCMIAYWMHQRGRDPAAAAAIGMGAAVAWMIIGIVAMTLGGKYLDDTAMPHVRYRRAAREAQKSEGMRDMPG